MEPLPGMPYSGGIQPPQRRSSQELIVTTGAGAVGTSAVRRNNIATVSNTRKKLGFGDEEEFYNQMYLGGQVGQSTMFPGQQQQQPPQQPSQQPPSQQKDAVAHNVYTPTGPGPAVGGMSSQSMMYSTGGLTGGMQNLSLHQQQQQSAAPRPPPLGTATSQFVNRSSITQTFPGMPSMTGMSQQLGGNNSSTSRGMMSIGSGGTLNRSLSSGPTLMSPKPAGRTSALSSAIGSALPLSSYGIGARTQPMLNSLPAGFGSSGLPDPVGHSFDLSDFPVLGARSRPDSSSSLSSAMGIPGILPSRHGYGTAVQISKPVETTSEFQIQNEDFPALPGSKPPTTKPNAESSLEAPTTENKFPLPSSSNNVLPEARPTTTSYDLAPGANKEKLASATPIGPPKGAQKRTTQPVSIPANMVQDQFGMMGLLTFIRAAETDPGLVALALGSDLTTLGLNLNSPESLCSTFASPWADSPCRAQDIDYPVPQEYLIHPYIRDKLAPIQLKRYNEDLLFFLYYSNGGELLQLLATIELYNRDWRYHKEERVWITRAPGIEPTYKTTTYERGTYCYFDTTNWRRMNKEFHIEYDKLEDRPTLPSNVLTQTSHIPTQT